jgi:hypothetical protein
MAPASPPDTVLTISGSFLNFCCKERRGKRGVGRGGVGRNRVSGGGRERGGGGGCNGGVIESMWECK